MGKRIDLTGQRFGRLIVLEDVGRKHGHVLWRCRCACGNMVDVMGNHLQSGATQACGCLYKKALGGQKFGRLTVLGDVGRNKRGNVLWRCLCDCGNTVDVITATLQKGSTQSCGCLQKERTSETNKKDLTNQKFGRLVVLDEAGRAKDGQVIWKCQCECGNTVNIGARNLQNGKTQSCGCYYKEQHSGENNWNWKGGITPLNHAVRECTQYKNWRTLIFQRDFYVCQHCGDKKGGNLIAHHIKFFSTLMEENHITTTEEAIQCETLWDVSNGITLCKKCHKKEHKKKPLTS